MIQLLILGVVIWVAWEMGKGASTDPSTNDEQIERERLRREKTTSLGDGNMIRSKEIELQDRGVSLPTRDPYDPAAYEADMEMLLRQTQPLAVEPKITSEMMHPPSLSVTKGQAVLNRYYWDHPISRLHPPDPDME